MAYIREEILKMIETGVVQARFQVLHLKHIEYILAAKMRCKRLFIGITYPDDLFIGQQDLTPEEAEVNRQIFREENPLTYYERYDMLVQALEEFGAARDEFEIVPFPIELPEYILQYLPGDATYFMTICDDEDERQKRVLEALKLNIDVLWQRTPEEKGVTGSEIRKRIVEGKQWKQLVPKTTYQYVRDHKIDQRIRGELH